MQLCLIRTQLVPRCAAPPCKGSTRWVGRSAGRAQASIGSEVSSMYVQNPGKGSAFYPRDVRLEEVDVDGEGRLRYVRFEHRPIYCIRCVVRSLQAHHLQRGGRRWRSMCMGVRACVRARMYVHVCVRVCVYVCVCMCMYGGERERETGRLTGWCMVWCR